ncbi:MAG: hypothetical protein VCB07_02635 [Gammaproteobacteria bacterium]
MTRNVQALKTDTQQTLHLLWEPVWVGMTTETSFDPMLLIERSVMPTWDRTTIELPNSRMKRATH